MEISPFGDNLTIFIRCENQQLNHWLAYGSWYSIKTNLPNAQVKLLVKRTNDVNPYFDWAPRRNLNCYRHSAENVQKLIERNNYAERPYLIIHDSIMAVREFDDSWLRILNNEKNFITESIEFWTNSEESEVHGGNDLCSNVTDSEITTFVQYGDFGNFVCQEWINRVGPFARKMKARTANESKVIDLWNRAQATIDL